MRIRRLIRSGPAALRALTALLLLAVVLGDLAFDADCDPLPPAAGELAVAAADDGDADACATGCIPDCFCCSRSLAAGPRVEPPAPDGVASVAVVVVPGLPPGYGLLAEHPPRARA